MQLFSQSHTYSLPMRISMGNLSHTCPSSSDLDLIFSLFYLNLNLGVVPKKYTKCKTTSVQFLDYLLACPHQDRVAVSRGTSTLLNR